MNVQRFYFLCKFLNHLIKLDETNRQVEEIKQTTQSRIDEATEKVKQVGTLQKQVLQKTTTFYLGKAMGGKY